METQEQIDQLVKEHQVVLFMKGNPQTPQCGFSATVVDILDEYLPQYRAVDVLSDPNIRQGIKDYSNWPTIPQLYVGGSFVGGCDIIREMDGSGELARVLGAERAEAREPVITMTEGAEQAVLAYADGESEATVRLTIDRGFQYGLEFDDQREGDVLVTPGPAGKVSLLMDRASARRADGMNIDYVEGELGAGFKMDNPNEPPKVKDIEPKRLKEWMDAGAPMELFDVRTPEERAQARIEGSRLLDAQGKARLDELDADTRLVFYCHHGMRSRQAAEHCLQLGFRQVFNLRGGIDAWSTEVDPSVPRY
jgi:monothiol glutaredoxin